MIKDRWVLLYWGLGGYFVGLVAGLVMGIPFLGIVGGVLGYFWGRRIIQRRRGEPAAEEPDRVSFSEDDRDWMRGFLRVKEEADPVVDAVGGTLRRGDTEAQMDALRRAADELPQIISRLDALPSARNARLRTDTALFIEGLRLFDHACRRWQVHLLTEDDSAGEEARSYMKEATNLMKRYSRRSRAWGG